MRNNVEHYKVFCINYEREESRESKKVAAGGNGRAETAGQVWPQVGFFELILHLVRV